MVGVDKKRFVLGRRLKMSGRKQETQEDIKKKMFRKRRKTDRGTQSGNKDEGGTRRRKITHVKKKND